MPRLLPLSLVRQQQCWVGCFMLCLAVACLSHLDHYALWDDEANTALFASTVWQTGYPSAFFGHNLIAYGQGAELAHGVNVMMPPLAYYVAAPFVGLLGHSAFASRLPFALLGLCTFGLIFGWLLLRQVKTETLVLVGLGLLGNVSLLLYMRQARYYSLMVFFSVWVILHYIERERAAWLRWSLLAGSLGLLLSHYLAYFALMGSLALDYVLWDNKRHKFSKRFAWLFISVQLLVVSGILWAESLRVLPPAKTDAYPYFSWIWARVYLFLWDLRDININQHGLTALLLIAPLMYCAKPRNLLLLRLSASIVVYVVVIALLVQRHVGIYSPIWGDLRYFVAVIPMFVALSVQVLQELPWRWMRYILALLLFGSNFLHVATAPMWGSRMRISPQITWIAWLREFKQNRTDAYTYTIDWLKEHTQANQSVATFPFYTTYPLMWHVPDLLYAWQLANPPQEDYRLLPRLHVAEAEAPDYLIAFGYGGWQQLNQAKTKMQTSQHCTYEQVEHLNVHTPELYRPELYWRTFVELPAQPYPLDGISIWQRRCDIEQHAQL